VRGEGTNQGLTTPGYKLPPHPELKAKSKDVSLKALVGATVCSQVS